MFLYVDILIKRRTLDPGPEAFIIRLCKQPFMNKADGSRRCFQRPTLSTSAGEQTVVATVP